MTVSGTRGNCWATAGLIGVVGVANHAGMARCVGSAYNGNARVTATDLEVDTGRFDRCYVLDGGEHHVPAVNSWYFAALSNGCVSLSVAGENREQNAGQPLSFIYGAGGGIVPIIEDINANRRANTAQELASVVEKRLFAMAPARVRYSGMACCWRSTSPWCRPPPIGIAWPCAQPRPPKSKAAPQVMVQRKRGTRFCIAILTDTASLKIAHLYQSRSRSIAECASLRS